MLSARVACTHQGVVVLSLLSAAFFFLLLGNLVERRSPTVSEIPEEVSLFQKNFQVLHNVDISSQHETHAEAPDKPAAAPAKPVKLGASASNETGTPPPNNSTAKDNSVYATYSYYSGAGGTSRILLQLVFGILYYCLIVASYPELDPRWGRVIGAGAPNEASSKLQKTNEVLAIFSVSCPNNCYSLFCAGPRGAHTFHSTGVMNYWLGLILMSFCPCCTLCYTNAFTDLNEKFGGRPRGWLMSCICAFCCSCCVIAQDAQSLDLVTGCRTTLVGVSFPDDFQWPHHV